VINPKTFYIIAGLTMASCAKEPHERIYGRYCIDTTQFEPFSAETEGYNLYLEEKQWYADQSWEY